MTDERIAKLPRWARDIIRDQGVQIRDLTAKIEEVPTEGATAWTGFYDHHPRPVAEREYIHFTRNTEGRHWISARLESEGLLVLMASNMMAIQPVSGNMVRVRLV